MSDDPSSRRVAIVGGGPGGLALARYLVAHRFEPVVFEQSDGVGGQWNARAAHSGIWPGMRTNTSRVTTRFGDLDHEPGAAVYPTNVEMLAYLGRYASASGIAPRVRTRTRVTSLDRASRGRTAGDGRGWDVAWASEDGSSGAETFPFAVIASGRFNRPVVPHVRGLEAFSGAGGVTHAFHYKSPEAYRGARVLVLGCAISALEIASDLALLGAARVVTAYRRQRYVLGKLAAGVPTDHLVFTRYAALAAESLGAETAAERLRDFTLSAFGSPEQYGALRPAPTLAEAGITLAQHFLPLVAEGRIAVRPWVDSVDGARVRFADGSEESFDAIVCGTGYGPELSFLGPEVRRAVGLDAVGPDAVGHDAGALDLHEHTFHPDLEGLTFLGLFDQSGPYFPVLELQARWIAYVWAGLAPAPSREAMERSVAACRARRRAPAKGAAHVLALRFARAAGVEPDPAAHPGLARALLFGPLSPAAFRLVGPDSLPGAAARVAADAAEFGALMSPDFTADERGRLEELAAARGDARLAGDA